MIATNAGRRTMLRALLMILTIAPAPLAAHVGGSDASVDPDTGAAWTTPGHDAPPMAPAGAGSLVLDTTAELDGATGPDPVRSPEAADLTGLEPPVAVLSGVERRLRLLRSGHVAHRLDLPPPLLR